MSALNVHQERSVPTIQKAFNNALQDTIAQEATVLMLTSRYVTPAITVPKEAPINESVDQGTGKTKLVQLTARFALQDRIAQGLE